MLRTEHPELSAGVGRSRATWISAYLALAACWPPLPCPPRRWRLSRSCSAPCSWPGPDCGCSASSASACRAGGRVHSPTTWLPIYSIVIALYREAAAVAGLVAALRALELSARKARHQVRAGAGRSRNARGGPRICNSARRSRSSSRPNGGPRTKPKALNAALPFVRGKFVAVFDAEDRPEPDQLRLALEAFVANDERLACVQARLTIDNTADSWLTRDVHRRIRRPVRRVPARPRRVAAAVAARRLLEPFPHRGAARDRRLGPLQRHRGRRSRHAARALRLSHSGHPLDHLRGGAGAFRPWLRQRTRWFKGWMQTWLVHMRSPLRLARELGLPGFAVFQLLVGGTVLAALVHVLFALRLIWMLTTTDGGLYGPGCCSASMPRRWCPAI